MAKTTSAEGKTRRPRRSAAQVKADLLARAKRIDERAELQALRSQPEIMALRSVYRATLTALDAAKNAGDAELKTAMKDAGAIFAEMLNVRGVPLPTRRDKDE